MRIRLFACVVTELCLASFAMADKWQQPKFEVFRTGDHEFRVDPTRGSNGAAVGSLVNVSAQPGTVLWKGDLVNLPHKARIMGRGKYVLTIDTYANLGFGHSLVVYGEKGKVLADLKLEDFLSKEEITKHVYQTESSRWWHNDKHTFTIADDQLTVELDWGKKFAVSLKTGKVVPQP